MKTRWSTVLAALGLTLMALGSGRAAQAASVTGQGTFVNLYGDVLSFTVSAGSDTEGILRVGSGADQVLFVVTNLNFNFWQGLAQVVAVVTHSTNPACSGPTVVVFQFGDNGATGDTVLSYNFDVYYPTVITSGNIIVTP